MITTNFCILSFLVTWCFSILLSELKFILINLFMYLFDFWNKREELKIQALIAFIVVQIMHIKFCKTVEAALLFVYQVIIQFFSKNKLVWRGNAQRAFPLINSFVNVLVCATYTPRSLWVFEHCGYYIM